MLSSFLRNCAEGVISKRFGFARIYRIDPSSFLPLNKADFTPFLWLEGEWIHDHVLKEMKIGEANEDDRYEES